MVAVLADVVQVALEKNARVGELEEKVTTVLAVTEVASPQASRV